MNKHCCFFLLDFSVCYEWQLFNFFFSRGFVFFLLFYRGPHTCMILNKLTQNAASGILFYFDSFVDERYFSIHIIFGHHKLFLLFTFFIFIVKSFIILILVCIPFVFHILCLSSMVEFKFDGVLYKRVKQALFVSIPFYVFNSIVV